MTSFHPFTSAPLTPDICNCNLPEGNAIHQAHQLMLIAYGRPAPQGSKNAYRNKYSGKVQQVESSSERLKPWREAVKHAALDMLSVAWLPHPLDGPLAVRMIFTMPKPKSAPKTRRTWPDRTPDLSKLIRSTEDALVDAGVIADDARVVEYERAAKVFPGEDHEALHIPGVRIVVRTVTT